MDVPWTETLSQILTMFDFGFSFFEKVFELREGMYYWKKWSQRHPATIFEWVMNPDATVKSVKVRVWMGQSYQDVEMPVDWLLIFTNFKEWGNYEGESILRASYKHWFIKDKLYRIDAIAHERHGVGLPIIKVPAGSGDKELDFVEKILEDMRSHEKGYAIEPEGFEIRTLELSNTTRNPIDSIKHHDEKIATSVLAQFINLGFSASGSRALGQSFSDFFLGSLNTYSSYVSGVINRYAIRQLIELNYGQQERYPEIACIPVAGIDFERMARSMMMLAQNGLIWADQDLVKHVHELLGLPQPDFKEGGQVMPVKKQTTAGGKPTAPVEPTASEDAGDTAKSSDAASQKPSEAKPGSPGTQELAGHVLPAIGLQVANVVAAAANGHNGRFRSPLEGTLLQALCLECSVTGTHEALEKAAREFSRRLASAAELAVANGDVERVRSYVEDEVGRSKPLLLAAIRAVRRQNDAV
jgi:hypothetical protein